MRECCVAGCEGPNNEEPVFFEFPTSRLLRKRWLDAIESSSKVTQDAVVCIRHFSREDYELVRGKTRLRSKVVPRRLVGDKRDENEATKLAQESTEPAINDRTAHAETTEETKLNNRDNDSGKVDNDSGNNEIDNKHNSKISDNNKDNEKVSDDSQDNENIRIDKKNNKEIRDKVSEKDKENASTSDKDSAEASDKKNNGEVQSDSQNALNSKNGHSDTENCHNHNDSPQHEKEKVNNDNNRLDSNDNAKDNNDGDKKALIDNGIVNKGKKTRCKITAMRVVNGRKDSSDSSSSSSEDSVSSSPPPKPEIETSKEDIEDALTNYYIENKKTERQVAAMADVLQEEFEKREEEKLEEFQPSEPVFIELSVGQGSNSEGNGPAENDCLMVLESLQCDVDPALLLADGEVDEIEQVDIDDDDDDEPVAEVKKKEDPISLLTSSDEDDVIIEEPHFDTVEVSSAETSEDDMPLVKLVNTPKNKSGALHQRLKKIMWGGTEYYCVQCRFTTIDCSEYTKHLAIHSKVLQICPECGFTTSSKAQMTRHKHKHKNERRFKCNQCNYNARHEMSLVYHMKTHSRNEVEVAICDTFEPASKKSKSSEKSRKSKKSKLSEKSDSSRSGKKHKCASCRYSTNRKSDLNRHRKRLHGGDDDDDESDE